MEWITSSGAKGKDKTTSKRSHGAGTYLLKNKAVLEERPLYTCVALTKLLRIEALEMRPRIILLHSKQLGVSVAGNVWK